MIGNSIVRNFVGWVICRMKLTVISGSGKKSMGYGVVQYSLFETCAAMESTLFTWIYLCKCTGCTSRFGIRMLSALRYR